MEQKRFLLFLTLSMAILIGWMNIGPILMPGWFPKPKPQAKPPAAQQADAQQSQELVSDRESRASNASEPSSPTATADATNETTPAVASDEDADAEVEATEPAGILPNHPLKTILLGSKDPESGYFLSAELTTIGGSVTTIELNDERYKMLKKLDPTKPRPQLKVVGNGFDALSALKPLDPSLPQLTLQTAIPEIDAQFRKLNPNADLHRVNWEIEAVDQDGDNKNVNTGVTFRIESPDGRVAVRKKFWLAKVKPADGDSLSARDHDPAGYELHFALTVENRGDAPETVHYLLQGPVGLPLENEDNIRKYRDIKVGFLNDDGTVDYQIVRSSAIAGKKEAEVEELKPAPRAFEYIGVDVQYFAALLFPDADQLDSPNASYMEFARPQVVRKHVRKERSDISVRLNSYPVTLAPGKRVTHTYALYAGPKRTELLRPLKADAVLDFSTWFGIGYVSKGMVWLLTFLHKYGVPYGIAIILMTLFVRGCMHPISKKQAAGTKKMKELQPQIAELKKKYGNEKEKMAKAQMELFAKNKYNPLAGCLPMFLQFPIFIGLYQSLRMSVDLRMAPFLWIDNLAAPDALFPLPFHVPIVGWTEFNLLPILTVILFVVQQKMFMPPAADEQSAMQQKMMNYMMIVFGFMFYRLPSGLCVYFIASSLWGMGERKLLDYSKTPDPSAPPKSPGAGTKKKKTKSLWSRLAERLEEVAESSKMNGQPAIQKSSNSRKKKGKKTRQKR